MRVKMQSKWEKILRQETRNYKRKYAYVCLYKSKIFFIY